MLPLIARLSPRQRSNIRIARTKLGAAREWGSAYARFPFRRFTNAPPLQIGRQLPSPRRVYRRGETAVPVHLVTPPELDVLHTFFDVGPLSPSGRYLVVLSLPFMSRIPLPGDAAQIVVVDLETETAQIVYTTRGWGVQLGAHAQWGADDDTLLCNDVIDGRGRGVVISRSTLSVRYLDGPVYGVTPCRQASFSPALELVNASQYGYGVPEHLFNRTRLRNHASDAEGIWRTDIATGRRALFMSIAEIVEDLPEQKMVRDGIYYIYNVKVSPCGRRLLAVLFSISVAGKIGWQPQLITIDLKTRARHLVVSPEAWQRGGHHANWCPGGDSILMNLRISKPSLEFVEFDWRGIAHQIVAEGLRGSGHPSFSPERSVLVTDAYRAEGFGDRSGHVPLRAIDVRRAREHELCRLVTAPYDGLRRVDPHPVWVSHGGNLVFNALDRARRQVLIAEMSTFVSQFAAEPITTTGSFL